MELNNGERKKFYKEKDFNFWEKEDNQKKEKKHKDKDEQKERHNKKAIYVL